jgi:hypothetical protein
MLSVSTEGGIMSEDRAREELAKVRALYDQGKHKELSSFGQGSLTGIQQTLLWLLEPGEWMEPLSTVPGLERGEDVPVK